ncbi:uncharacterized protein LOC106155322 [Lingula anatina]|uniref:Uncharacterized protein LOC106155322 n=1 Tax=Lingula anatina TaxID=7574 RepID=A0A1S3HJC4_LINAN|nr:uncharacterized protein LOC106155322 [Lingula anatina]|eukprot:XP_013385561.1 uncharacterized protein LOC106155322 [Lingula anatina]
MSEKMKTLREETGSEGSSGGRWRDVVPIIPGSVVQSVPSYITDVKNRLPDTEDRLLRLKQELERRKRQLYAPYNGELGIHSYQNWQLPHYHMVRSIVDETVNRFLDMYFRAAIPTTNITAARAMMEEQSKELSRTRNYLAVQAVADDALQEIMEEAVHEECTRVAEEYKQTAEMIRVMTANMIMKQIEIVTTGAPEGRGEDDPAYNMVTKAFYRIKKNRDKYRKEIWGHSQNITVRGKANVQSAPEEDDVTILKFHNIVPVNLKNVTPIDSESDAERAVKRALISYQNVESLYWKTKVADVNVTHLSKKCHGIHSAKLSRNRNLLAVGTGHGDIIVYDMRRDVMKPVQAVRNESVEDSVVVDISWSVTGRRLVTVDKKGAVKVWSMTPGELSRTGLKALELQADAEMFVPPPLTLLAKLQADSRDFNFTAGTLFEMDIQKGRQGPVLADFYPAVSLLGSQSQVCIALRSGDILKCDLESTITGAGAELQHVPNIIQEKIPVEEEEEKSTIGQGVPGELLRQHRRPLIHMCFIETIKNMVTVDQAGYINVWRYSRRQFSEFHWFTPYRKYKMLLSKREYVPVPNVKSEVIFTDMQTQHRKTRQEIARERENAEEQIKSLNLGNPWYSDSSDKDRVKLVYPVSKDILDSEAGGMFHVIFKHTNTNLLSTYGTRRYKPVMVNCTKLLHCKSSPDGTLMVFVLLFPAFKTKAPHLTVISLDLMTMTIQDVRLDVPLTDDQYRKCQTGDAVHCFAYEMILSILN